MPAGASGSPGTAMKQLDSHHRKVALGIFAKCKDLTLASLCGDGAPHAALSLPAIR